MGFHRSEGSSPLWGSSTGGWRIEMQTSPVCEIWGGREGSAPTCPHGSCPHAPLPSQGPRACSPRRCWGATSWSGTERREGSKGSRWGTSGVPGAGRAGGSVSQATHSGWPGTRLPLAPLTGLGCSWSHLSQADPGSCLVARCGQPWGAAPRPVVGPEPGAGYLSTMLGAQPQSPARGED